jgi:glutathione synthase/RimK-type ligase-like ATP-grasp enzyme
MWVNDPSTTALADAKVSQLFRARSIGFAIPRTIVTNNPQAARGFAVDCGGDLIAKSLRSPVVRQSPPAFVYTSRLSAEDIEAFDDLRLTPCILQERVHKSLEVRATVVGHSVFAAALDIHGVAGAGDDWRRVEASTIRHTRHELPEDIAQKCIELTHSFGLVFSAIDLILKPDGSYCFLECNPNGEWGWIVDMTGLPIARAIAEILVASQSDLH